VGARRAPARKVDPERLGRDARLAREALGHLGEEFYDDYDRWVRIGMALSQLGDDGPAVWHERSSQARKYAPRGLGEEGGSLRPGDDVATAIFGRGMRVGLGSLFRLASEQGWESEVKEGGKRKKPRRGTFVIGFKQATRV